MKLYRTILSLTMFFALLAGCKQSEERIPWAEVRIVFNNVGDWNAYGVPGAYRYQSFIRPENKPEGFPFTAMTYTGFGGVLLVGDALGNPLAYDLACPVEVKYDVRVFINTDTWCAECPQCHSTYDVFLSNGAPLSGKAAEKGWHMARYRVGPGRAGEYLVISN